MGHGLTPRQEIVEIKLRNLVSGSPKAEIDQVLAEKPAHRIVSMSLASSEEFNTAGIVLLVIEYLEDN
ncbi:MAG: hypothetical protein ACNYNX_10535 [Leucobacter sp.]